MASTFIVYYYAKYYASISKGANPPPELPSSHEGWANPDMEYQVDGNTTPADIPATAIGATPELMAQYQLTPPVLPAPTSMEDGTVAPDGLSARHVWWIHEWVYQNEYGWAYNSYYCIEDYVVYIDTAAESPDVLPVPIIVALLLLALLMAGAAGSVTGNHQANKAHIYRKEATDGSE